MQQKYQIYGVTLISSFFIFLKLKQSVFFFQKFMKLELVCEIEETEQVGMS